MQIRSGVSSNLALLSDSTVLSWGIGKSHPLICLSIVPIPSLDIMFLYTSGESGELGRTINLQLRDDPEPGSDGKPEYDLYRIWKEHLTPVSIHRPRYLPYQRKGDWQTRLTKVLLFFFLCTTAPHAIVGR